MAIPRKRMAIAGAGRPTCLRGLWWRSALQTEADAPFTWGTSLQSPPPCCCAPTHFASPRETRDNVTGGCWWWRCDGVLRTKSRRLADCAIVLDGQVIRLCMCVCVWCVCVCVCVRPSALPCTSHCARYVADLGLERTCTVTYRYAHLRANRQSIHSNRRVLP